MRNKKKERKKEKPRKEREGKKRGEEEVEEKSIIISKTCGKTNREQHHDYQLCNQTLSVVKSHPCLGVHLQDDLGWICGFVCFVLFCTHSSRLKITPSNDVSSHRSCNIKGQQNAWGCSSQSIQLSRVCERNSLLHL